MKFIFGLLFLVLVAFCGFSQLPKCIKPIVSGGNNKTVALSASFAMFTATATSQNGKGISGYVWTQVSGPTATLVNANTKVLTVDFADTGTYIFSVKATDSCGAFNSSSVSLVVQPNSANSVTITPNVVPGNGTISITTSGPITGTGTIQIFDKYNLLMQSTSVSKLTAASVTKNMSAGSANKFGPLGTGTYTVKETFGKTILSTTFYVKW